MINLLTFTTNRAIIVNVNNSPERTERERIVKTYTKITTTTKTGSKPEIIVTPITALTAWKAGVRHAKDGDVVTVGHLDLDKHTTIHTVITVGLETAHKVIRDAQ